MLKGLAYHVYVSVSCSNAQPLLSYLFEKKNNNENFKLFILENQSNDQRISWYQLMTSNKKYILYIQINTKRDKKVVQNDH